MVDSLAVPHNQPAAVNPDDHRTHVVTLRTINIGQNLVPIDLAVGYRRFHQLRLGRRRLRMDHAEHQVCSDGGRVLKMSVHGALRLVLTCSLQ